MMKDLEFDFTIAEEDLFDDTTQKSFVEDLEVKIPEPKKDCVLTKKGLAELTRRSVLQRERAKKENAGDVEIRSPEFQGRVDTLADNVIEWCNYEAACGKWRHVYDLAKMEPIYFKPVLAQVRQRMKGVMIIIEEKRRRITIEWGSSEV